MRTVIISCFSILLFLLMWSCKTYKPIEKDTIPSNPALSKEENFSQQLAYLKEGDRISIIMDNQSSHDLIFIASDSDTLKAKLQKPKISQPIKIALDRIQVIKTEQKDVGMTFLMIGLTIGLAIPIMIYSFNNFQVL